MLIDIEDQNLQTIQKKDKSGSFQLQDAYVHTVDREGKPKRYPEPIAVFVPRDDAGGTKPYPLGTYEIDPTSFEVQNGRLQIGFLKLKATKKGV